MNRYIAIYKDLKTNKIKYSGFVAEYLGDIQYNFYEDESEIIDVLEIDAVEYKESRHVE